MATIIPLTGSVKERIMTCLRAAGWYAGRQTDLTAVKAFYASGGITLPNGAEAFLREYYGIAENWHLKATREKMTDSRLIGCAPEIEFLLYPHRGIPDINREYFDRDEEDLTMQRTAEEAAGEPLVQVGSIGYYYPAAVYLAAHPKSIRYMIMTILCTAMIPCRRCLNTISSMHGKSRGNGISQPCSRSIILRMIREMS